MNETYCLNCRHTHRFCIDLSIDGLSLPTLSFADCDCSCKKCITNNIEYLESLV